MKDCNPPTTKSRLPQKVPAKYITLFDGSLEPMEFNLSSFKKDVLSFGRAKDCDIVLKSPCAKKNHGYIYKDKGLWFITSQNNKLIQNKNYINDRQLEDGDAIFIEKDLYPSREGVLFLAARHTADNKWRRHDLACAVITTIGSGSKCDVVLDCRNIAPAQMRIVLTLDGLCLINDDPKLQIFINDKQWTQKQILREKDIVTIGNTKLVLCGTGINWRTVNSGIRVVAQSISKTVGVGFAKRRKTICNDMSFVVEPCELVAIVGGSGAGKTTVMNCISGYSLPTDGNVSVNNVDLHDDFAGLKKAIGYVPQQIIVHEALGVESMLNYAARLRMPIETSSAERKVEVARVLEAVDLVEHKKTQIKKLSGGQKKRASIAVELFSNPSLFFLDEPTSGLDPSNERKIISTLRQMTTTGKTVIFSTHSTLSLHLCDKILFIGTGGKLCFYGTHDEALAFFEMSDIVDVYNLVADDSEKWSQLFSKSGNQTQKEKIETVASPRQKIGHNWFYQTLTLLRRNLHVLVNDHLRTLLLILQAPALALMMSLVAEDKQFVQFEFTRSILFALACAAFWLGLLNAIQEICKERSILRREYMTGLYLGSYIWSKIIALGIVCAIQSVLLTSTFAWLIGVPDVGILSNYAYPEMLLTVFLTALAATAIGLFVSALFKNVDRVMTLAPVLLIPQLLFAGLIFELKGFTETISIFATGRFAMEALGTTANLNSLSLRLQEQGIPVEHIAEDRYLYTVDHFESAIIAIALYVPICCFLAWLVLRSIKKEQV